MKRTFHLPTRQSSRKTTRKLLAKFSPFSSRKTNLTVNKELIATGCAYFLWNPEFLDKTHDRRHKSAVEGILSGSLEVLYMCKSNQRVAILLHGHFMQEKSEYALFERHRMRATRILIRFYYKLLYAQIRGQSRRPWKKMWFFQQSR